MPNSESQTSRSYPVLQIRGGSASYGPDEVAVEEPLEIRLHYGAPRPVSRSLGLTLRTPGNDIDLVAGHLLTEGVIQSPEQLRDCRIQVSNPPHAVADVTFENGTRPNLKAAERVGPRMSSCGACGRKSLPETRDDSCSFVSPPITQEVLDRLPTLLDQGQHGFQRTGGLHGAALLDLLTGEVLIREDIGRHNAVDKVLGHAAQRGDLEARPWLLFVTSRAGYEIVQKAAAAHIRFLASMGAPSSIAIELAREHDLTLLGFVRQGRCNLYTGAHRVSKALQQASQLAAS